MFGVILIVQKQIALNVAIKTRNANHLPFVRETNVILKINISMVLKSRNMLQDATLGIEVNIRNQNSFIICRYCNVPIS